LHGSSLRERNVDATSFISIQILYTQLYAVHRRDMWPNQSAPRGPSGLLRDARRHARVCGSPSRAIDGNADRGRGGATNGMTWELTGLKTVLEPPPPGGGSFVFQALIQRHRYRRGEAPVAGRSPTPSWAGFDSPHPCWCDAPLFRYGLYPSRPNRSLKTEEIANKRIGDAPCLGARFHRSIRGTPSRDGTWP
jgi:hypothetical protein